MARWLEEPERKSTLTSRANHLFGRGRQRGTARIRARGDSRWRLLFLSEVMDIGRSCGCWRTHRQVCKQRRPKITSQPDRVNPIGHHRNRRPRRVWASAIREATMDKRNTLFLHSSAEYISPANLFGKVFSNSDLYVQDRDWPSCWCYCSNSTNQQED